MRSIFGLIVGVVGVVATGCSAVADNDASADQEIKRLQSDNTMVVSDWYRKGYFKGAQRQEGSERVVVYNKTLISMLGLHAILWLCMSVYTQHSVVSRANSKWGNNHPARVWQFDVGPWKVKGSSIAVTMYLVGNLALMVAWVAFWLLGDVLISIVSPGSYIPFDFVGFLTLVGFYGTTIAYFVSQLMRPMAAASGSGGSTGAAGGAPRVVRAMLKALFVAVASGIGGKLGGWIGGMLVFVLSAGVSAIFELPSHDHD